jgi:predicted ATPase/two-component SAPR family response regulator
MRRARIADTVVSRRPVRIMPGGRAQTPNQLRVVTDRRENDPPAAPTRGLRQAPNRAPAVEPPPKGNLPLQLSSFVGREREMAEVEELLAEHRLLTLTGPGGCGKTRLALAVASELAEDFEDGAWWVGLASLSDPDLVAQAVAQALVVREAPGRSFVEALAEHLGPTKTLLVLDNCEHLVDACAALADALLHSCQRLKILATSREALGIAGERTWLVPPLTLPGREAQAGDPAGSESVRLFVERASAAATGFALTLQNTPVVAQICRRLEGMPLAIELAAARTRVLSVEQIDARLDDAFHLLTGGSRTAVPRQRALRAAMDWSHDLLSEEEKVLFRRLSVFAGGFTLGATEEICSGEGIEHDDVLDLLSHLVDKSLVVVQERGGEARYRLLETVRQYGWEKLEEAGEAESVRRRHAIFFLALAEEVEPKIEPNVNIADRRPWLEHLEIEHDNLRAALRWAQESSPQTGLLLANALYWLWYHRGYLSEGRSSYERALAGAPAALASPEARAKALCYAGYLAWAQGDHPAARSRLQESVEIGRRLGGGRYLAHALWVLGMEMLSRGEIAVARSLAEESVGIFRTIGDEFGLSISLANLGAIVLNQGDYALAASFLEESVAISRKAGDEWMLSLPLRILGVTAFQQGDHDRAEALIKESLALLRELGDKLYTSRGLECLAAVVSVRGDYGRAARLFGAGEALREAMGASVLFYLVDYDRGVAAARDALGEEAFAATWAEGRAMSAERAIEYALDEPSAIEAKVSSELLRIFALGPGRVERGGHELAPSEWTYAKSRELLFYLLGQPSRTKEQIGLALWPEASPSQLRSSFHRTLHHLRRALGRPEWISFENGRYSFNRSLDYWFDVEAFESELAEARRHGAGAPGRAIRHLEEAIDLYKGDFLEELAVAEGEWALERQEELRRLHGEALLGLGGLLSQEGRYAEAAEAYRKAIAHDELLEAAHRELMRCHARLGERSQALRHYQALVELLREELGSLPAPETAELHRSLLRGEDV